MKLPLFSCFKLLFVVLLSGILGQKSYAEGNKFNWKSIALSTTINNQDVNASSLDIPSQIFGLRYSMLNQRKIGIYGGVQLNISAVETAEFQFNDNTQKHNFSHNLVRIADAHEFRKLNLDVGITKKILGGTWLYLGSGVCQNRQLHKVSLFDENGSYVKTIDAEKVNRANPYTPSGAVGVLINLRILNVGLGIKSFNVTDFQVDEMYYSAMLGITLKRRNQK